MSLTKAERTTTINYDDEGEFAEITTYSRSLITSLRKNAGAEVVHEYPDNGFCFRIPKKLVSVRNARKPRRAMTPEEREAAKERLARARAARGTSKETENS